MAARAIIRIGDTTSHGGTVLEAFSNFNIFGKNGCGIGHRGYCPQCKTDFVIVAGAKNHTFMGKNVALEGMLTSCGAVLIASQWQATVDTEPGAVKLVPGPLSAMIAAGASLPAQGPNWIEFALPGQENYQGLACTINFDDGSSKEMTFDQASCLRIDSIAEVAGIHVEIPENEDVSDENLSSKILNLIEG